jgi:transcriptional regulator with XRE-family HTH domain
VAGRRRTKAENKPSTIDDVFRIRLPIARHGAGLSQAQLAQRLRDYGYAQLSETAIAKIESGTRRVALGEALALTAALGCQFAHIVTPSDDDANVRVAGSLEQSSSLVRGWLRGSRPMYAEQARLYFTGPLVPDSEYQELVASPIKASGYGPSLPQKEGTDA